MTDQPGTEIATRPAAEPATIEAPERPSIAPHDAAALGVMAELDRQFTEQPDGGVAVAINPGPLVDAVLVATGDIPRVPQWIEGERRRVGGAVRGGALPEPEIAVDLGDEPDTVKLVTTVCVQGDDGITRDVEQTATVPAVDAITWAHNVLSAAQRSRTPQ